MKSCNKVLIGRTYWQSVALTSILYGAAVITMNNSEIQQIQRCENKVCRFILGGPGYVALPALRGELGMTAIKCKDMKAKLKYAQWIMNSGNKLIKQAFQDMYLKGKGKLVKKIKQYLGEIGIENIEGVIGMSETTLVDRIELLDESEWTEQMRGMSTLEHYRVHKTKIKQEIFYDNNWKSVLLFRSRSNSLKLNWRNRFIGGSTTCSLCPGEQEETLYHFVVQCPFFTNLRNELGLQDRDLSDILLFSDNCDVDRVKEFLEKAWRRRIGKMREDSRE